MNLRRRSLLIVALLVVSAIGFLILFAQRGGRTTAPAIDTTTRSGAADPLGEPSLAPVSTATASTPFDSTPQPATAPPTALPTPLPADDVPMVRIPAGEFIMGSTADEIVHWESVRCIGSHCGYIDYVRDEWPQMTVYLDEFEIDQVEVTYARYERCVEAGVCSPPSVPAPSPDHPVLVAWVDAHTYCQWVGKRLPTEAEWEKAARGTDGRIYPWGNEWDPARLKIHWVTGEGFTTAPVGSYPQGASPYGTLDMAGNAPEWVSDLYQAYPGGRLIETTYFTLTTIQRGGYFNGLGTAQPPEMIYRAADRFPAGSGYGWWSGFRCMRGPEPPLLEEAVVSAAAAAQPPPLTEVDLTGMVEIPAGEFQMGDASSDVFPAQTVYLDTFYIDRYETTNAEYVEFLNALGATYFACNGVTCIELRPPNIDIRRYDRPSRILEIDGRFVVEEGYENYPAVSVSWNGADAYCRWRGKRLPTDAEWEKAARGTDGRVYPWGELTTEYHCKISRSESPVGSCPEDVSPYGVGDVARGVMEWVSDWHDSTYYLDIPEHNPTGPAQPSGILPRVLRPGSMSMLYTRAFADQFFDLAGVRCAYTP